MKKVVECGPDGAATLGVAESGADFLQGKTAMYLDATAFACQVTDPTKSQVVGKVAWAPHPAGVRAASQTGGFGIAIPQNAADKKAAFLVMQGMTSTETDKKIALAGGNPIHCSTHTHAEVNAAFRYVAIVGEALKNADPGCGRSSRSGARSTAIWRPDFPRC